MFKFEKITFIRICRPLMRIRNFVPTFDRYKVQYSFLKKYLGLRKFETLHPVLYGDTSVVVVLDGLLVFESWRWQDWVLQIFRGVRREATNVLADCKYWMFVYNKLVFYTLKYVLVVWDCFNICRIFFKKWYRLKHLVDLWKVM